jgi:hypothetical protein
MALAICAGSAHERRKEGAIADFLPGVAGAAPVSDDESGTVGRVAKPGPWSGSLPKGFQVYREEVTLPWTISFRMTFPPFITNLTR